MGQPDGSGSTELSFSAAMEELEAVLHRIEGDEIDIDQLGAELGRAAKLLEVCRTKIRRAEVEVQQIVEKIEEDEPVAAAAGRAARMRGSQANQPGDVEGDEVHRAMRDFEQVNQLGDVECVDEVARVVGDIEPDLGPALHRSDYGPDHSDDKPDLDAAREQGNLLGQDDDIPF